MTNTIRTWCLLCLSLLSLQAWAEMEGLDDESLDGVMAQASLFSVDYIPPGGGNPNTGIGFYRLALDSELQMNANIEKLALGCGGVKGGGCDIDIDFVRLTGVSASGATDSGPGTSAILTRPFFEFAIKNPGSAATREIVGIRFGAEQTLGRMSMGKNPDVTVAADDTGINSFSGDMNAVIKEAYIYDICADLLGICLNSNAVLDPYNYADLHGGQPLIFNRSINQDCGSTAFPGSTHCMFFDKLVAHADLFGLTLDSTLTESLRFIHDLGVTDELGNAVRGLYLSVQKQAITWQKVDGQTNPWATVAAQQGWWLSIPQVTIEKLEIQKQTPQLTVSALGALFGQPANLQNVDLGQVPVDNCYGALQFC